MQFLHQRAPVILSWKTGGLLLGLVFLAAVVWVKPIGVAMQFAILDRILWDVVDPQTVVAAPDAKSGYSSPNAYLNKSGGKYAKSVTNFINYSFVLVLALVAGGGSLALLRGGVSREQWIRPEIWRVNFYDAPWKGYLVAFVSDFIVLYGALGRLLYVRTHDERHDAKRHLRLYLFMQERFSRAYPTAILLFRRED